MDVGMRDSIIKIVSDIKVLSMRGISAGSYQNTDYDILIL